MAMQGTIVLQLQSENVVTNSANAESALKRVSGAATQTGKEVEFSAKKAGLAMGGLVTNIASATFAYKNLGDMQLNVAKAAAKMDEKQDKVNKLLSEGKQNTDEYNDAVRDLTNSKEGYAQMLDKVQEAHIMFALNLGTMAATTIPAMITAMKGLNLSMGAFTTILNTIRAHPVFLVVTAGILAWEFGISKLIKNYNGLDLSIQGNLEKLTEQTLTTKQATQSMQEYGDTISSVGSASSGAASSMSDLNKQMDYTINNLKKNDIRSSLNSLQEEMASAMIFAGSLEQIVNQMRAAGVEGFVQEFQKDTRLPDRLNQVKSTLQSIYEIVNGRALPKDALGPNIAKADGLGFVTITNNGRMMRIPAELLAGNSSYDTIAYSRVRAIPSFVQDLTARLKQIASSRPKTLEQMIYSARTGGAGGKGGFAGASATAAAQTMGNPGPHPDILLPGILMAQELNRQRRIALGRDRFSHSSGAAQDTIRRLLSDIPKELQGPLGSDRSVALNNAQRQAVAFQSTLDLLATEGLELPGKAILGRGGKGNVPIYESSESYVARVQAAISEAQRRRESRISPYRGLGFSDSMVLSMLKDPTGFNDLEGMKLYKSLGALA